MNLKINILYVLLSVSFIINASENPIKNEDSKEEFTGKSSMIYGNAEYIRPESSAAKALEKDASKNPNIPAHVLLHGSIAVITKK